ncbi:MAG: shikimate dehydrogenase [Tannerellaceae bacterium]|jgi:shikimate dehydrogenase|nr:shikimate dehydrogenase [Tannerellaceae bacterium]
MKKYGLIGFPLGHSFSKDYFSRKFVVEKIDAEYLNFAIKEVNDLERILKENPELNGLNVTIPHKIAVMDLLDEIDDDARIIGAVNVLVFRKDPSGRAILKGYNSDVAGFELSLKPLLKPSHRKALILGTGGASKAVLHGLKRLGLECLFVSRTEQHSCITYSQITPQIMEEYTLIVNTTPLGMYPNCNNCPDIPYHLLSPRHLLYDLIYNPEETRFLSKGQAQGASIKNGLEMLLIQANIAWTLWNR